MHIHTCSSYSQRGPVHHSSPQSPAPPHFLSGWLWTAFAEGTPCFLVLPSSDGDLTQCHPSCIVCLHSMEAELLCNVLHCVFACYFCSFIGVHTCTICYVTKHLLHGLINNPGQIQIPPRYGANRSRSNIVSFHMRTFNLTIGQCVSIQPCYQCS